MKKIKRITISIVAIVFISLIFINVQAGVLDDAFNNANDFTSTDKTLGNDIKKFLKDDIVPVIGIIGNLVFAGVTVILGAKYIWSGADGKSTVKETLPTFVIAVIFFYLAESLVGVFTGDAIWTANSFNSLSSRIIGTINLIVRYLAFGGILFIGLQYMFASANRKAKIKDKLLPMCIGIIFVFSASQIVSYIIGIGSSIIK